jgi:hypothetical protein
MLFHSELEIPIQNKISQENSLSFLNHEIDFVPARFARSLSLQGIVRSTKRAQPSLKLPFTVTNIEIQWKFLHQYWPQDWITIENIWKPFFWYLKNVQKQFSPMIQNLWTISFAMNFANNSYQFSLDNFRKFSSSN